MDTSLLLYLNDQWERVDLYEDIPISLVLQELDILDLKSRKSPYTKTFTVPSTNNNANIFEHYYEVNGTEFNPLTKINCVVQYRGTDIFLGVLRLNAVINNPTYTEFEVYIMGEVGDFVSEIKNLTLQEINWTDLLHTLDYSAVTTSWEAKDNDTDGLFGGKILYPLINWGYYYPDTGTTPTFSIDFNSATSFSLSGHPVPTQYFKPAIRVKEVVNRIFDNTSYTLISEFMDTDYFKSMYMSMFGDGNLGVTSASATTNQNIFKVQKGQEIFTYKNGNLHPLQFTVGPQNTYDPLGNWTNNPLTAFRAPYPGTYYFNLRFNYRTLDITMIQGQFVVQAKTSSTLGGVQNGTLVYTSPNQPLGTAQAKLGLSTNLFFSVNLNAGDYMGLFLEDVVPYLSVGFSSQQREYIIQPYSDGTIDDRGQIFFDCYNSPSLQGEEIVDVSLGIPNISCSDFLQGLVTMFNLIVVQEPSTKQITIEPYTWYYDDDVRDEKDYTQKLDLDSTWKIEPLSFSLPKELNFQYGVGTEEYLNMRFEDSKAYTYGRFKYVSDSNLLTDVQDYEIPFVATPTDVTDSSAPNIIIPKVYREVGNQFLPYSSKPHIFFWCGNRFVYTDKYKQIPSSWYLLSGSSVSVEQTTYPCVSHLSSLDIQLPSLVSDLNFGSTFDFFGNSNDFPLQYTNNTLYNLNWRDYIENNYSNETRRLTGRFFMKPTDIYELKLTDKLWVKDSYWRLEKLNDGNLIESKLTEMSLIKERGGFNKTVPPAPFYPISGNTPFPGLLSAYTETVYSGQSITPVCSGTSNNGDVLTFGIVGFTNLQEVWYDTGVSYAPLPIGTYIRPTGTTTTYVVIDKQGRILEQDC